MPRTSEAMLGAAAGPSMSNAVFRRLSEIVRSASGINLTPVKKVMLTVRLTRRIRALCMDSFEQYARFVESPAGRSEELTHMIDAVSTNKTEFFREAEHFGFLMRAALPELEATVRQLKYRPARIWSAGCASGEEAYTLAMVLSEYRDISPAFRFSVVASDISTRVLEEAERGIYDEGCVRPVPDVLRTKYLMKGKGRLRGYYRVVPELRRYVSFRRQNLAERDLGISESHDVIFCRNVVIYMDRTVQETLFHNFYKSMTPGGYLFVGHSETLEGISDMFVRVAPTIYRRP